jgi:hypothetical protein
VSDKEVTHIIQVRRGMMRVNFPFDWQGLVDTWPTELANSAVSALLMLQMNFPDRENPNPIDPRGKVPMVLKLQDSDGALNPVSPLEYQLSGKWSIIDAEKLADLGAGGVQEVHGRCSFVVLELVDSLRAV